MFGLKNFKLVKKLTNIKPQIDWLKFSNTQYKKNKFLTSLIAENKFIEEDIKIRLMVEKMIREEFPEAFKNQSTYEFLVDSVIEKIKQNQMGKIIPLEE